MPRSIATACHVAYVCDMTGEGLLLPPLPVDDVDHEPGTAGLHAADELAMLRHLSEREGFELSTDEDDEPWCSVGFTADGREAFSLYGLRPITSLPSLAEQVEARAELREAAGLKPAHLSC